LGVEVVEILPGAGGKEAVADIPNGPLHPTLLVAAGHRHRAWLKAVVGGKGQQCGVEANGVALALQDGTFQIVVEQHPRQAAPSPEGRLVAT
jgi:hypothetical protein